jgi:hypothetical protein
MHRLLLVALSAAVTLVGAALVSDRADAISLAGAADVRSAQDHLGIVEKVERVCRQFCDDGYCRTRCFNRDDDDDRHRDRDRDRREFRDRDRALLRSGSGPRPQRLYSRGAGHGLQLTPASTDRHRQK